jgi:hypothetical protein
MTVEELKRLVTEWHGIAQSAAIIYDSELREALAFIDELGEKTAAFDQPYRSAPQLREGYVRKGGTNPDPQSQVWPRPPDPAPLRAAKR